MPIIVRAKPGTRATPRKRFLVLFAAAALAWSSIAAGAEAGAAVLQWYKGQTHAHSLWSDGDEFPEMVADWYKSHGYQFLVLTDHNWLMEGQRWVRLKRARRPISKAMLEDCRKRFGNDWLDLRGEGDARKVRLKTFDEVKKRMDEPGRFLFIQGEEITSPPRAPCVHLNAINLCKPILPQGGSSAAEAIRRDLRAVEEQSRATGRRILAQVNHPTGGNYAISAADLAAVPGLQLVEMCNNNERNHNGDSRHPGVERLWDIANTIRLLKKTPPVWGIGSDDAHHYHDLAPDKANPGRAWIVVRAKALDTDALLEAIQRGDFYVSTGVVLKELQYDEHEGALYIQVDAKPNTQYTIELLGTRADVTLSAASAGSPKVGKVLARHDATKATYRLTGKELYVRAVIRSNRKLINPPSGGVQVEQAWTQPVGWENRAAAAKESSR